jgi:hypothetical protein
VYKYLIAVAILTPLIGIWMVEGGEFAGSVGVQGYPNGASFAYAIYATAVVTIALICTSGRRRAAEVRVRASEANALFRRFSNNLLILEIGFLVVFLFGFGAINVWLGRVEKSEFRTSFGQFGAIPNSMSKFILPALVAYASMLFRRSSRTTALKMRLAANFMLAFVIGASWGFKSTGMASVLPALLLLNWRIRPIVLITLTLAFVASLILFFFTFDVSLAEATDVQTFLLQRFTVLQGDVAWYIWDLHSAGQHFPNYWPTLLAGVGDKLLSAFGVSRSDSYEWMLYHYDWMITYLAGVPLDAIVEGHSIVATPFAEGLIAGGLGGVAVFALIAGVLTGWMYRFLDRSLRDGRDVSAALGATYFCYNLLAWLISGTIVELFHISLLINFSSALLILTAMRRVGIRTIPVSARIPAAEPQRI